MGLKKLQNHHYRAMELRLLGKTYAEIGEELGRKEASVKGWFIDPLFKSEFEALKAEGIERAKASIAESAARAARRVIEILDSDDERPALSAAKDILDRAGLGTTSKAQIEHKGTINQGYDFSYMTDEELERELEKYRNEDPHYIELKARVAELEEELAKYKDLAKG
ncbi:MAG: hypothetical protein IBX64_09985 [Actinobacteria bacterium]|nr:hypothetical protein [Actinomycetota bacterium]